MNSDISSMLIDKADKARRFAYAPYSDFRVGAALLCTNGQVYTGCNIENASFSATICAERVALATAINDGAQDFAKIAIVAEKVACPPCGVCAQVLSEFVDPECFSVIWKDINGIREVKFADILPFAFSAKHLKSK